MNSLLHWQYRTYSSLIKFRSVYHERKERQSVLSAVDCSQKETMYEQMKKALIQFHSEEFGPHKGASTNFRVKGRIIEHV